MIQAAGLDLDNYLTETGLGAGDIPVFEPVEPEAFMDLHFFLPRLMVIDQVVGLVVAARDQLHCFHRCIALFLFVQLGSCSVTGMYCLDSLVMMLVA